MLILNQDRDMITILDNLEEQTLLTVPNMYKGEIQDLSLYLGKYFLGTFNSSEECAVEINLIVKAFYDNEDRFSINGFCRLTPEEEEMIVALQEAILEDQEIIDMFEDL